MIVTMPIIADLGVKVFTNEKHISKTDELEYKNIKTHNKIYNSKSFFYVVQPKNPILFSKKVVASNVDYDRIYSGSHGRQTTIYIFILSSFLFTS